MRRTLVRLIGIMGIMLPWLAAAGPMEATVRVDEKADNVMHARSAGLARAEQQAFFRLLEQLIPDEALEVGNKVKPDQVSQMVQSFEILEEKTTAGRYQAEVLYRFNEAAVEKLLSEVKGLVPGSTSQALLVIPAYDDGKTLKLWEPDNVWRNNLNSIALQAGKGVLVMPYGDPKDVFVVDHETILSGDKETLTKLAERYGTRNVVVAMAKNVAQEGEMPHIQVLLRRAGAAKNEETVMDYPAMEAGETKELLLVKAAKEVAERLVNSTQQYSLNYDAEAASMQARVVRAEFRHNRDWMELRRSFDNLPKVEYVDIGAISPGYAQLTLYFRGSDIMIEKALVARGLSVEEVGQYWRVSLR